MNGTILFVILALYLAAFAALWQPNKTRLEQIALAWFWIGSIAMWFGNLSDILVLVLLGALAAVAGLVLLVACQVRRWIFTEEGENEQSTTA